MSKVIEVVVTLTSETGHNTTGFLTAKPVMVLPAETSDEEVNKSLAEVRKGVDDTISNLMRAALGATQSTAPYTSAPSITIFARTNTRLRDDRPISEFESLTDAECYIPANVLVRSMISTRILVHDL